MADNQTAESTQAEQSTGSQAEQVTQQANAPAVEAHDTISIEKYNKVQSEAKNLRARLKEYEDKERASLPEQERITRELEQAKKERDQILREVREGRIMTTAHKAGAIAPDALVRLVPDDAEDIEKAVRDLQKQYPFMFSRGSADGGQGQQKPPVQDGNLNTIIRQLAGR